MSDVWDIRSVKDEGEVEEDRDGWEGWDGELEADGVVEGKNDKEFEGYRMDSSEGCLISSFSAETILFLHEKMQNQTHRVTISDLYKT